MSKRLRTAVNSYLHRPAFNGRKEGELIPAKTAILVIHGIGEQKPFETLDAFVRPLATAYSELSGGPVRLEHDLAWIQSWGESHVTLTPESGRHPVLDVFEYYWSHLTQRRITAAEVISWLVSVARGAQAFYGRRGQDIPAGEKRDDRLFRADGEFDHLEYLIRLISLGGLLKPFYSLATKLIGALPFLKAFKGVAGAIANVLAPLLYRELVDYLGDVALYCSTDVKSEYYAVRKAILDGAVEKAKWLAASGDYDRVFFCGHSLGSVIAYDVMDRLNLLMSHDAGLRQHAHKIAGLATFGSPLDKIAFFFDERIDAAKEPLRHAIVSQLHGFGRKNIDLTLPTSLQWHFGGLPWLNFWTPADIISGRLDVYKDVSNIKMDFSGRFQGKPLSGIKLFLFSHLMYWQSPEMFAEIVRMLQKRSAGSASPE